MENFSQQTQEKRRQDTKFQKGQSGNPTQKFTSKNQPTGAAKSFGKLKKKRGVELIKTILELEAKDNSAIKQQAADYFAIPANQITIETLLILRQVQKAIEKSDGPAFNSIMDRLYGKAAQSSQVEITHNESFLDFLKSSSAK